MLTSIPENAVDLCKQRNWDRYDSPNGLISVKNSTKAREELNINMKATVVERLEQKLNKGENALIMAVGDSITWGLNHCTAEETYCAILAELFGERFPEATVLRYDGIMDVDELAPLKGYFGPITVQRGESRTITLVRSGVGGNTVRRALKRTEDFAGSFLTGELPDVFLLMFGINDALKSDPSKFVVPEKYYQDLKKLYTLLQMANPTAELVFLTPTYNDLGEEPVSHLVPYCEKMKQLAKETGTGLIDTHQLWQQHLITGSANYGQREWLSGTPGDSCHFSPEGSRATAEFIFRELGGER